MGRDYVSRIRTGLSGMSIQHWHRFRRDNRPGGHGDLGFGEDRRPFHGRSQNRVLQVVAEL